MNKTNISLLSFLWAGIFLLSGNLQGQIGGDFAYGFLRLSPSARITALGGVGVPVTDGDLGMSYYQPASLSDESHQAISFNQSFFPADIRFGLFSYGHHLEKANFTLHGGIQYIDYGDFGGFDRTGRDIGTFGASEYTFYIGAGRAISERLSVGANFKVIYSALESYNSAAVAADISMIYEIPEKQMGFSFVLRNAGTQLSLYDEVNEDLPLDIQVAFAKRLKYLPFRFGIAMHSLNRWDLGFNDPRLDELGDLFGEDSDEDTDLNFIDEFSRHLVISGEFLLGPQENFNIRFAYRNQRRAELGLSEIRSFSGFSGGVGFRVNRFKIDYGFAVYHIAGTEHHISLSSNIQRFTKDREL